MQAHLGPCEKRYPAERYFQLNLIPLARYGTIEFRAHSATHDADRVTRWVQFLIAFVEYFGRGAGKDEIDSFSSGTSHGDYIKLQEAQKGATAVELFNKLSGQLDTESKAFFESRRWEVGNPMCRNRRNRWYMGGYPMGRKGSI